MRRRRPTLARRKRLHAERASHRQRRLSRHFHGLSASANAPAGMNETAPNAATPLSASLRVSFIDMILPLMFWVISESSRRVLEATTKDTTGIANRCLIDARKCAGLRAGSSNYRLALRRRIGACAPPKRKPESDGSEPSGSGPMAGFDSSSDGGVRAAPGRGGVVLRNSICSPFTVPV